MCSLLGSDVTHWLLRCRLVDSYVWTRTRDNKAWLSLSDDEHVPDVLRSVSSTLSEMRLQGFERCLWGIEAGAALQARADAELPPFGGADIRPNTAGMLILWDVWRATLRSYLEERKRQNSAYSPTMMRQREAARCIAGLRFAMLRFTMQRLVAQHLEAIKKRLWQPHGRLVRRRAAEVLPDSEAADEAGPSTPQQARTSTKRPRDGALLPCHEQASEPAFKAGYDIGVGRGLKLGKLRGQFQAANRRFLDSRCEKMEHKEEARRLWKEMNARDRSGWEETEDLRLWWQMQADGTLFRT